jgi:hypothetical protein
MNVPRISPFRIVHVKLKKVEKLGKILKEEILVMKGTL